MQSLELPSERAYAFIAARRVITILLSSLLAASVTYAAAQRETAIKDHYVRTGYMLVATAVSEPAPSQSETLMWLKSKLTKEHISVDLRVARVYAEIEALSGCDASIVAYNTWSTNGETSTSQVTWTFVLADVVFGSYDEAYKDLGFGAVVISSRDGKEAIQAVVSKEAESGRTSASKIKDFMIAFASPSLAERVVKAFRHARTFCLTPSTREPF